jgi:hypothetical protein
VKTKNPRLLWQSRVLKISLAIFDLKFHTHDAGTTRRALPNGHTASDRRVRLHQLVERRVHFYAANKQYWRWFVKGFSLLFDLRQVVDSTDSHE